MQSQNVCCSEKETSMIGQRFSFIVKQVNETFPKCRKKKRRDNQFDFPFIFYQQLSGAPSAFTGSRAESSCAGHRLCSSALLAPV